MRSKLIQIAVAGALAMWPAVGVGTAGARGGNCRPGTIVHGIPAMSTWATVA